MSLWRIFLAAAVCGVGASAQINIQLSKESTQAFDDYVKSAEAKMDWRAHFPAVKPGDITISAGGTQSTLEVKDALIHDWAAAALVPGGTVKQALAVLQSYNDYKKFYAPQVTDSKLLDRQGDHFRVYLRLNKSKGLISAVLDSEYNVDFKPLEAGGWSKLSRSAKINEIQFGKAQPDGTGVGFLWRLNAYWIVEPRPGGVYLECRSISMSRDIPPGLGWMIKPMISSLPRESLRDTMRGTIVAMGK